MKSPHYTKALAALSRALVAAAVRDGDDALDALDEAVRAIGAWRRDFTRSSKPPSRQRRPTKPTTTDARPIWQPAA